MGGNALGNERNKKAEVSCDDGGDFLACSGLGYPGAPVGTDGGRLAVVTSTLRQ